MDKNNICKCIKILFVLFLFLLMNTSVVLGGKLEIFITNLNDTEISEIYEKEHFKVSVLDSDQPGTPYLVDVNILFNDLPYEISQESAEITLQAPRVDSDRNYKIFAIKDGYDSSNKTIKVLNNVSIGLVIITEDVVDAGKTFSVYIKNEKGEPIADVTVGIENYWSESSTTDSDGRAWLTAPLDKKEITILAQKDKYTQVKHKIRVNIEPAWWETIRTNSYFPIVIGLIFLLFVIIYVNQRQKKSIIDRTKEISKEKKVEISKKDENYITTSNSREEIINYRTGPKDVVRSQQKSDSKIEEIRITRPKKEIIPVKPEKNGEEKIISKNKINKNKYDWFEGTDDVRYEIDKLTGKIDENGKDKWFEGVDKIKEKIDEKVKNKDKKKDEKN